MLGVLEGVLAKQEWLVGGKPTISDFSFITYVVRCEGVTGRADFLHSLCRWNDFAVNMLLEGVSLSDKFPAVAASVLSELQRNDSLTCVL